jgi:hypothetical protein
MKGIAMILITLTYDSGQYEEVKYKKVSNFWGAVHSALFLFRFFNNYMKSN